MKTISILLLSFVQFSSLANAQLNQTEIVKREFKNCESSIKPAVLKKIGSTDIKYGGYIDINIIKKVNPNVKIEEDAKAIFITTIRSYTAEDEEGDFVDKFAIVFNPKTCKLLAAVYWGEE